MDLTNHALVKPTSEITLKSRDLWVILTGQWSHLQKSRVNCGFVTALCESQACASSEALGGEPPFQITIIPRDILVIPTR